MKDELLQLSIEHTNTLRTLLKEIREAKESLNEAEQTLEKVDIEAITKAITQK